MRDADTILGEFDNPADGIEQPDSTVSSTRERIPIEVLLNIRDLGAGIKATLNGTTAVHIIGFIAEKLISGSYGAIYYVDSTGVLGLEDDLSNLVITI